MVKNIRRLLAERRKFRTKSDFELLFEKDWISGVEDCNLLSILVERCIREKGLTYTNSQLKDNDVVLNRLNSVNKELAYRVKSGNLLSEFVVLGSDLVHEVSSILKGLQHHILEIAGDGIACIEDKDDKVLIRYSCDASSGVYGLGDDCDNILNLLLEEAVVALLECIPVSIKRLYFPVSGKIVEGNMHSSEEVGSYVIHLNK